MTKAHEAGNGSTQHKKLVNEEVLPIYHEGCAICQKPLSESFHGYVGGHGKNGVCSAACQKLYNEGPKPYWPDHEIEAHRNNAGASITSIESRRRPVPQTS